MTEQRAVKTMSYIVGGKGKIFWWIPWAGYFINYCNE
jgi:hypothetical protein